MSALLFFSKLSILLSVAIAQQCPSIIFDFSAEGSFKTLPLNFTSNDGAYQLTLTRTDNGVDTIATDGDGFGFCANYGIFSGACEFYSTMEITIHFQGRLLAYNIGYTEPSTVGMSATAETVHASQTNLDVSHGAHTLGGPVQFRAGEALFLTLDTTASSPSGYIIQFETLTFDTCVDSSAFDDPHFVGLNGDQVDLIHDADLNGKVMSMFCTEEVHVFMEMSQTMDELLFMSTAKIFFADGTVWTISPQSAISSTEVEPKIVKNKVQVKTSDTLAVITIVKDTSLYGVSYLNLELSTNVKGSGYLTNPSDDAYAPYVFHPHRIGMECTL